MGFKVKKGFKTTAGISAYVQSYKYYPFHSHDTYIEIICVLNGSLTIFDSAVQYHLNEKEVHILNSADPHKLIAATCDTSILVVHIDKTVYNSKYEKLPLGYFTAHSNNANGYILPEMDYLRFLMAEAYLEYRKDSPSSVKLDNIACELIDLLFEEFHDYSYTLLPEGGYNISRRKYDGRDYEEFYRVYRIADYIETYFDKPIKLSDIARNEFLSVPYMSKYIKQNIGVSFNDLLSIARVSEAERLLNTTNKPIDQIASEVGFSSRSHLFKHFARWFSKSPSAHRKEILEDMGNDSSIQLGLLDQEKALAVIYSFL